MLIIIDNYDSFTYNLAHIFGSFGMQVQVYRNDDISLADLQRTSVRGFVIGSGTMEPTQAGISCDVIREFAPRVPILGVGLGHHCLAHVYGASFTTIHTPVHGKTMTISHQDSPLFQGISSTFKATCYHTRVVAREHLSSDLYITATDRQDNIMGLKHREFPVESVQFHPESILTRLGPAMLANFARRLGYEVPQHNTAPLLPQAMWPEQETKTFPHAL